MTIYNVPYNPRTDPKALFAQGFANMLGGLGQGLTRRRIADFAGDMDPEATAMEIVRQALLKGMNPQIAFGLGGLQQRSTQGLGVLPGWWNEASAEQRKGYLNRVGGQDTFGSIPRWLQGDTEEETKENLRRYREKYFEPRGRALSITETDKVSESVKKSVDNARDREWGPNYTDENLFREWKKYVATYKFDNDTQRESVWNTFKNEVESRGGSEGHEVEWDPNDPKWRQAIGLTTGKKMKLSDIAEPKTRDEFINKIRELEKTDHELGAEYYNKYLDKFW